MHNQHAHLSQTLADQHITRLREHATRQQLLATANPPRRRRSSPRHRWQLLDRRPAPRTN